MKNINAMEHLVSNQNGVYAYHVLAKNFPLYVEFQSGVKTELDDFLLNNSDVMNDYYTKSTVFNPNDERGEWCENIEYLTHLGLYALSDNNEYWHIESIEGDIYAINPAAEWSEEDDVYIIKQEDK